MMNMSGNGGALISATKVIQERLPSTITREDLQKIGKHDQRSRKRDNPNPAKSPDDLAPENESKKVKPNEEEARQ
jgi:hypothetical protein